MQVTCSQGWYVNLWVFQCSLLWMSLSASQPWMCLIRELVSNGAPCTSFLSKTLVLALWYPAVGERVMWGRREPCHLPQHILHQCDYGKCGETDCSRVLSIFNLLPLSILIKIVDIYQNVIMEQSKWFSVADAYFMVILGSSREKGRQFHVADWHSLFFKLKKLQEILDHFIDWKKTRLTSLVLLIYFCGE